MNLYFEAFLGTVELFTITEYGEIRTLNTCPDTPETRAALVSIYGASEVTKWESATK